LPSAKLLAPITTSYSLKYFGSEIRFFRHSIRSFPPPLSRLLAVNTHRVFTNRSRPRYLARVLRPLEPNSPQPYHSAIRRFAAHSLNTLRKVRSRPLR
jgi:hypothetical protein